MMRKHSLILALVMVFSNAVYNNYQYFEVELPASKKLEKELERDRQALEASARLQTYQGMLEVATGALGRQLASPQSVAPELLAYAQSVYADASQGIKQSKAIWANLNAQTQEQHLKPSLDVANLETATIMTHARLNDLADQVAAVPLGDRLKAVSAQLQNEEDVVVHTVVTNGLDGEISFESDRLRLEQKHLARLLLTLKELDTSLETTAGLYEEHRQTFRKVLSSLKERAESLGRKLEQMPVEEPATALVGTSA